MVVESNCKLFRQLTDEESLRPVKEVRVNVDDDRVTDSSPNCDRNGEENGSTEMAGVLLSLQSSLKDGAYYCYCAYVLRITRYSDFLSPMRTNTGIFLRRL